MLCNVDFVNPINFFTEVVPLPPGGNTNNSEYRGAWHQFNYPEDYLVTTLNAS